MGAMGEEEMMQHWEKMEMASSRERILVSVRLRPLNAKEILRNDVSDWECINDNTIIYRNSLQERSAYPTAYSFGILDCTEGRHHRLDDYSAYTANIKRKRPPARTGSYQRLEQVL